MEDTLTYVVEPEGFKAHLADLDRLGGSLQIASFPTMAIRMSGRVP
jgi:hypothetical protein